MLWLPPFNVELETEGNEFGHIAFSGSAHLLVTKYFIGVYKAAQLSGLQGFDSVTIIKVVTKRKLSGDQAPLDFQVRPVLSGAAVDDNASSIIRDPPSPCSECRLGGTIRRFERIILEAGSWSGEDIFFARGLPGVPLVSARFEDVCKRQGIKNANFVQASKFFGGTDNPP